ncbi:MAG: hypothetical protein LBU04_08255 [Christensenellaceae bacterium]|nr:hypothetical protein [Christensenellaceae bacterium]
MANPHSTILSGSQEKLENHASYPFARKASRIEQSSGKSGGVPSISRIA